MFKFCIFLLLFPCSLTGQDSLKVVQATPSPVLKFSILSLADPVSSVQFAFEYPVSKRGALQHEGGYVTRLFYNANGDRNMQGFRFRNEYRYYFYGDQTPMKGFYVAPEIMYTHLWFERNERDMSGCSDNCFELSKLPDYPVQKIIIAVHPAKAGYQKTYNRFVLDMYGGLGYRHVRVNAPSHINEDLDEFVNMRKEAGVYNLWSLSLGFKLGYKLY